jgi:hypothetical protein
MKLASTRAACDRIELIQLPFTDPPVMERRRFVSMIVLISGQRPLRSERPFSAADERKAPASPPEIPVASEPIRVFQPALLYHGMTSSQR